MANKQHKEMRQPTETHVAATAAASTEAAQAVRLLHARDQRLMCSNFEIRIRDFTSDERLKRELNYKVSDFP